VPVPHEGPVWGLAIVENVVTAAGGTIEAKGSPGGGLTVRSRFP
jgi:signal transduction histidine kinase